MLASITKNTEGFVPMLVDPLLPVKLIDIILSTTFLEVETTYS